MPAQYNPGDRVRVRWKPPAAAWSESELVDGLVWSYGPRDASYWVIPDRKVPGMIQGCIDAQLAMIEPMSEETLW